MGEWGFLLTASWFLRGAPPCGRSARGALGGRYDVSRGRGATRDALASQAVATYTGGVSGLIVALGPPPCRSRPRLVRFPRGLRVLRQKARLVLTRTSVADYCSSPHTPPNFNHRWRRRVCRRRRSGRFPCCRCSARAHSSSGRLPRVALFHRARRCPSPSLHLSRRGYKAGAPFFKRKTCAGGSHPRALP